VKVSRTAALGARVVQRGQDVAEARVAAAELAEREHLTMVHPYDDPAVIAGQGTIALELLEEHPDLDTIVVPVGGGGLISGIAVAAHAVAPSVEVVGVQTTVCPSMVAALTGAPAPTTADTIADGIAVREPGKLTVPIVRALVRDVVTVEEATLEEAVSLYLEIEKVVAEPAGAAPLAALLEHRDRFAGKCTALVLSGGNISPRVLSSVIVRSLARSGRLTRLLVEMRDRPGSLARLTAILAERRCNVIEVAHRRDVPALDLITARVELTIETRDRTHVDEVVAAVRDGGFEVSVEQPIT
jgi:threonine dehydratase